MGLNDIMQELDNTAKGIWGQKELRTQYHIIDSGNGGYQFKPNEVIVKNTLVVRHNAGLFSCSSIALEDLMIYFNRHKQLPDDFDRHAQYMYYKHLPSDTLISMLFNETDTAIPYTGDVPITFDNVWFQWSDYKKINFAGLKPFVDKYFAPSEMVLNRVRDLEQQYNIDYENTIGVLYRGNDKVKECGIAGYEQFIECANAIDFCKPFDADRGNYFKFLVSPDETEFLEYFNHNSPNKVICPTQWLHMPKDSNTAIFMHLPHSERPEHALNVLASIIMLSKCKHVITGTGNMSFWLALYRGNVNNFHQIREGQWL